MVCGKRIPSARQGLGATDSCETLGISAKKNPRRLHRGFLFHCGPRLPLALRLVAARVLLLGARLARVKHLERALAVESLRLDFDDAFAVELIGLLHHR